MLAVRAPEHNCSHATSELQLHQQSVVHRSGPSVDAAGTPGAGDVSTHTTGSPQICWSHASMVRCHHFALYDKQNKFFMLPCIPRVSPWWPEPYKYNGRQHYMWWGGDNDAELTHILLKYFFKYLSKYFLWASIISGHTFDILTLNGFPERKMAECIVNDTNKAESEMSQWWQQLFLALQVIIDSVIASSLISSSTLNSHLSNSPLSWVIVVKCKASLSTIRCFLGCWPEKDDAASNKTASLKAELFGIIKELCGASKAIFNVLH